LYVEIRTLTFKPDTMTEEISQRFTPDALLEVIYQYFEDHNGKNILMNKQDFQTVSGAGGLKASGTFELLDEKEKKSDKKYYEVVVFRQNNAFQLVIAVLNETNSHKAEIIDRIINSVELG